MEDDAVIEDEHRRLESMEEIMNHQYVSQSHEDWLRFRKTIIGGSDVGAILGFNRYRTAIDVYREKTDPEYQQQDSYEMKIGRMLENTVAELWESETNLKCVKDVDSNGNIIVRIHPEYSFLGATLDRLILPHDNLDFGVLEIKTGKEAVEPWTQGPPLSYYAQIQHQLSVTGYNYGQFAVLLAGLNGFTFKIFPIERDDEFIELMNRELIHFWEDHVLKGVYPEPMTGNDVEQLYPQSKPYAVEVNEEVYQVYLQLVHLKNKIQELENQKAIMETQMKLILGNHEEIRYSGKPIISWKNTRVLDEERLKMDHPLIYEEYRNKFNLEKFKKENPDMYNQYLGIGPRRFIIYQ